jgi:hypothetical protein
MDQTQQTDSDAPNYDGGDGVEVNSTRVVSVPAFCRQVCSEPEGGRLFLSAVEDREDFLDNAGMD